MRIHTVLMLILCAVMLAACGKNQPAPTPTEPETPPSMDVADFDMPTPRQVPLPMPAATPAPVSEDEPVLTGVNALTGLPIDEAFQNRRPVAITLNNEKPGLPMCGVSQADIIYEVPIEGGDTRLLAVYQNMTVAPDIGTVRSARLYFLDIAQGLDAILIHCGGSPEAYSTIASRGMAALDALRGYENRMFWRDAWRRKNKGLEHSLFLSTEKAEKVFETLKYPIYHDENYTSPYTFTDVPVTGEGETAGEVISRIPGSNSSVFNYDENNGLYYFTQRNAPFMDGGNDKQVAVRNLLILRTDMNVIKGDTEGRLSIRTTGKGTGFYACDGKIIPIRWSKEKATAPYLYTREDGTPLELARGQIFICMVTNGASVTYS